MKFKALILTAALSAVICGCGTDIPTWESFAPAESSIYITHDGRIKSAVVESFEGGDYTSEELMASAEEDLALLPPDENISASVAKADVLDGSMRLILEFADTDSYAAYLSHYPESEEDPSSVEIMTVAQGAEKGMMEDSTFLKAGKGKEVPAADVMKKSDYTVAAVEGASLIQPEGKVAFVSEGVEVLENNMVRTPADGTSYIIFK